MAVIDNSLVTYSYSGTIQDTFTVTLALQKYADGSTSWSSANVTSTVVTRNGVTLNNSDYQLTIPTLTSTGSDPDTNYSGSAATYENRGSTTIYPAEGSSGFVLVYGGNTIDNSKVTYSYSASILQDVYTVSFEISKDWDNSTTWSSPTVSNVTVTKNGTTLSSSQYTLTVPTMESTSADGGTYSGTSATYANRGSDTLYPASGTSGIQLNVS